LLIIISKDLNAVIAYYFVVGLAAGGRVGVGLNYMAEFVPEKYQGSLCSLVNCGDACVMIFQSIYYLFCKNWLYLHIYNLLSAGLIILLVMLLPESPQYYYANKKFDLAREALIRIAKINGNTEVTQKYI
jgi:MFS family permease